MRRAVFVALSVAALMVPTLALAETSGERPSESAAELEGVPHADRDGNRIADRLDAILAEAAPGDRIEVLVTYTDGASASSSAAALPPQALQRPLGLVPGFLGSLNKGQITALANQPGVVRVSDNFAVGITNDANNDDFGTALARADYGVDGMGVGICVIDTGYDPNHEQLDDPGKLGGWFDAIGGQPSPYDDQGHGTHVAATAAGSGTGGANAAKYRGVAPAATVYAAKALNSLGTSVAESVELSIAWCVAQEGVDIISMSLGTAAGSDGLDPLSLSVNAAVDAGKVVVVAAGNSGDLPSSVGSPGAAEKAITVGAVAEWSADPSAPNHSAGTYLAPFSSRGPTLAPSSLTKPDIAAPGVSVISAAHNTGSGYAVASGTSMATPFTAGTVALMLDADPTLTTAGVSSLLSSTAVDVGPAGKDNHWGWGLIDGYALVAEASGDTEYEPTIFPRFETVTGSVGVGGTWTHSFELTNDDLTTPIAATIILDGVPFCALDLGPFGCLFWEWNPDLEARLIDPSGAELALSECPALGDCGVAGQQETLHAMPTTAGEYVIEVFPVTAGGTFSVYLSAGVSGATDIPDVVAPLVSVVSPLENAVVAAPVSVSGSASDDVGVDELQVQIFDRDTGEFWDGVSGWTAAPTRFFVPVDDQGAVVTDWVFGFDPGAPYASQAYIFSVRSFDTSGNPSVWVSRNFFIGTPADVVAPLVSVVSPLENAVVAAPVSVSGSASDDVGVDELQVQIFDRDTGEFWDGVSGWTAAPTRFFVPVDDQGAVVTDWVFGFDPGAPYASQAYIFSVRSFDTSGNPSVWVSRNFFIGTPADVVAPLVSVVSPLENAVVAAPVSVSGSASDDVGVDELQVQIFDRDTGEFWDGVSGWTAAPTRFFVPVDDQGAVVTDWVFGFDPGAPYASQAYIFSVRSFDTSGNPSVWVSRNFFIGTPADVVAPLVSVVSPLENAVVAAPVSVSGSASDDVGVDELQVQIFDRDTGEFWDGVSGWTAAPTRFFVPVDDQGAVVTDWVFGFDPGAPYASQAYIFSVRSFDTSGNPSVWASRNFFIDTP